MKFYDQDGDQIWFWDKLEDLAEVYGERGLANIWHFRQRFEQKIIKNRRLRIFVNPWGEIKRLRIFIDHMRHEEWRAAKNALDLYAENEVLRQYRDLAAGSVTRFVPIEEYKRVKRDLDTALEKVSRGQLALNKQQKEWTEYMQKHG